MQRALRQALSLLPISLSLACGGTRAAPLATSHSSDPTEGAEDESFGREKELPPGVPATAPDGSFQATFPSTIPVEFVAGRGHLQAHFSLGTAAKTRCFFYQDAMDAGQAVGTVLGSMRSKVTFQTVRPYRIVTSGGAPVVFVDARYELEGAEGKQYGGLKLAVSPRTDAPALCFLDEAGYKETFVGAITALLGSIQPQIPSKEPLYSELWTISSAATPLGFRWLRVMDREEEPRAAVTLSAQFLPGPDGELKTTDALEVVVRDEKGIKTATFIENDGGTIRHDLELKRIGKGKFRAQGSLGGEEFKATFKESRLTDELELGKRIAQLTPESPELKAALYDPTLDPAHPTPVAVTRAGADRVIRLRHGEKERAGTLDEKGQLQRVVEKTGTHELLMERVEKTGSPE